MIPAACRSRSKTPRLAVRLGPDEAAALAAALASGAEMLVFDGAIPPGLRTPGRRGPWDDAGPTLVLALEGPDAPLPAAAPDAVLLQGARCGRDVAALGARLAVHEAEQGWPDGAVRILAEIADAAGVLAAGRFAGASARLVGLGLDEAAVAAELGAEAAGETLARARALVRLAAAAAGVTAFVTVAPEGAERAQATARREGIGLLIPCDPGRARAGPRGAPDRSRPAAR